MKMFIALIGLVIAAATFAQQAEADQDLLIELKSFCMEIAAEDGTGEMTMQDFLLQCINEELEAGEYKPITELPVE